MSIDARKNSTRGRPSVDTEEIRARVSRELLIAMETWIAEQPDPKPSRPEAIRQLIKIGIDASIPRNPA